MAKLKVYRTAIGFRDAYVAAPSQAAALRAWGTQKNLFARGMAELVTDPDLMEEPLARPGELVYRTRGSLTEQVAALGKLPQRKPATQGRAQAVEIPKKAKRIRPKPSRAKLDAAENAITALEEERSQSEAHMRERERALAAERAAMEDRFAKALERLKAREREARAAYTDALRKWEP